MERRFSRVAVLMLVLGMAFAGMDRVAARPASSSWPEARMLQDDGQDPGLPQEARPPSGDLPQTSQDPFADQDGMLPPVLDPDDDDDGVQDRDDSHPNDPTRGEKPPPGPTDPIADDDGDGLPNVMDPDDNNNGMPDAEEGVGPVSPGPPAEPQTPQEPDKGKSPDSKAPAFVGGARGKAPLVRALPSTGTGSSETGPLVSILLIGSGLLLATGHWTRRRTRT